jgi:hypothetical protein
VRPWEVDTTRIDKWLDGLDDNAYDKVLAALEFLADHGPAAPRPFVDRIEGSRHHNMKELRPHKTRDGQHIRIVFAFDKQSRAITLVAGDKSGDWKGWYRKNIKVADDLFDEHLATQETQRRKGRKEP